MAHAEATRVVPPAHISIARLDLVDTRTELTARPLRQVSLVARLRAFSV
jgi:hypothetical protein